MKYCNGCDRTKRDSQFAKKGPGKLNARCKLCHRTYLKGHYRDNKKKYQDRRRLRKLLYQESLADMITKEKSVPCKDCGNSYHHSAMTFDHLKDKVANISDFTNMEPGLRTTAMLLKELTKCEVVCANCHLIREWNRKWGQMRPARQVRIAELQKTLGLSAHGGIRTLTPCGARS